MVDRENLIKSLPILRARLLEEGPTFEEVSQKAAASNPWFTNEFVKLALDSIVDNFLNEEDCRSWLALYQPASGPPKKVAVIMAGNLPLVGFHDLFCILMSGHQVVVKLSDKDTHLLPWFIAQWIEVCPELSSSITYIERLEDFDAVIATGSNNSSRYFDFYFKAYPHILRRNRNGVAVLTGDESQEELLNLSKDIFQYFGLGCRNVSKVYVPQGYDFSQWNDIVLNWDYLSHHHKFKNNLEYNFALYIINSIPHLNLGSLILKEDDAIASRIGSLHYSYYTSPSGLLDTLESVRDQIQCVVSVSPLAGWDHIAFGTSQLPKLNQYADGVDTMTFLSNL